MNRLASLLAVAAALGACAPVVVTETATSPAFPEFIDAGPVIVVAEVPAPAIEPAAPARARAPARQSAPAAIPDLPEPSSELPPEGDASCGGVGIEAGC